MKYNYDRSLIFSLKGENDEMYLQLESRRGLNSKHGYSLECLIEEYGLEGITKYRLDDSYYFTGITNIEGFYRGSVFEVYADKKLIRRMISDITLLGVSLNEGDYPLLKKGSKITVRKIGMTNDPRVELLFKKVPNSLGFLLEEEDI